MPFIKRSIEPVKIRQGALKNSRDISLGGEHEVIVNKSYTQILLQLSQLATFANEIFRDLSQECQGVIARSQRLKTKVWEVEQRSKQLNVLETPLPESSLEDVGLEVRENTPVQPTQDTGLFTSITRPEPLQKLYLQADLTPRAVFAALGPPGWKSAKKFCLTPVLKEPGETTYRLTKRDRAPYKIAYERNEKLKPPRPRTRPTAPRPQSCAGILDFSQQSGKSILPTPEETVLRSAKSQPSILITIDTSATAFERFAQSRASLRNLQSNRQSYAEKTSSLSRFDLRRQTISGPKDLHRRCHCEEELTLSTEKLLETNLTKSQQLSKRKNPDLYIEDNSELFDTERSRSKEKKESVIKKLVRRSRSLPRNIGRDKSREILIPPDFYDINPQHSLIVSQNGAYINDNDEKIYTNFYGAPNTELPSPLLVEKMRKSKSDHQINDRLRSKSSSVMEDSKLKVGAGKRRPRSVSAERSQSLHTTDEKRYNSLSRTFTGLFGKGRKSKTLPPNSTSAATHSRDSLNTVFTSNSDGTDPVKRLGTRLSSHTMLSTQITLRKRHSKATTSSSGRWSGSERFSMDSDGLFSSTSQQRLSRVSADRDSALGADINDNRTCSDDSKSPPAEETHSLYSVDQDGFYTTMHTDIQLMQDKSYADESPDVEDAFANLSLMASSTSTSTHTLNDQEKTIHSNNHNSSLGSFPDSEQTEEILQRVQSKVEAGLSINRYSLVMKLSDSDEEDDDIFTPDTPTRKNLTQVSKSNLIRSQTYESELDLVLEDLSEAETGTIHSDTESVLSLRLSTLERKALPRPNLSESVAPVTETKAEVKTDNIEADSKLFSEHEEQLLRYKLLNGCSKYQKLPSSPSVGQNEQTTESDNSRSCKSLPRNMKNITSNGHLNGLITTLDNMGSWPRKLSRITTALSKETPSKPSSLSLQSTQQLTTSHSKRRNLSPGKLKGNNNSSNEKTEKIHSLIEEARRMSSSEVVIRRPLVMPRPLSQPECILNSINSSQRPQSDTDLVSPYASSNVIDTSYSERADNFIRQPSYKMACSNQATTGKILPRSYSEDSQGMKRNYSYRLANKTIRTHTSDTLLENKILESSEHLDRQVLARAPSYKLAQSRSFDRTSRAPSYRRALDTIPHEVDSGLGSGDMTSSGSIMTSSNESNQSEGYPGRASSYRAATDGVSGKPDIAAPVLHHTVIKECMKGVYENEETHLSKVLRVPCSPEMVSISMVNDNHHYSVPRIPAQPTSFNPTYANVEIGVKSKQAYKKSLHSSKSAPAPPTESEETEAVAKSSLDLGKSMTPPTRSVHRRARPMSSYTPNANAEESENIVPHNRLMLPKYNQSAFFPSMEMLKRDEMAVKSVLGKIRRSTRPLSYVQTDI